MLRDLVSPARAPVVVAIALVRTFARVVPAAVAVSASAVAVVVSIPTKRLVVGSAGPAITVASASVAAAAVAVASITVSTAVTAAAVVATAAAATKPTSWSSRTSRGAVRWAIAIRSLVADATTAPAKSVSTPTTAAEASSEASAVAASETPSSTTTPAAKATAKATTTSKATRASRSAAKTCATTTTWACSRALGVASATKTASVAARAPARDCTTSLHVDQHTAVLDLGSVCFLVGGFHVLLAFVDNEGVTTFLFLWWCVGRGSRVFDNADTLNGTVAAEFTLEVIGGHVVRETGDEQRLKGVALYFGIFAGFVFTAALAISQVE